MIKKHILFIFIIVGLVYLYHLLDITCPFLFLFKIPCPTCGMTRSLISLLQLDFRNYFHWNPFTIPVIISSIIIIHINILKAPLKKPLIVLSLIVLSSNFIYYVYRLSLFLAH